MGETIAEAIRKQLDKSGGSQSAAADHLGVSQPTLNRWITGVSVPSDQHIATLARWMKRKRADVAELVAEGRDSIALRAVQDEGRRRAQADVPEKLDRILADLAAIKSHLGIE